LFAQMYIFSPQMYKSSTQKCKSFAQKSKLQIIFQFYEYVDERNLRNF
jgi:hypothetical protein